MSNQIDLGHSLSVSMDCARPILRAAELEAHICIHSQLASLSLSAEGGPPSLLQLRFPLGPAGRVKRQWQEAAKEKEAETGSDWPLAVCSLS